MNDESALANYTFLIKKLENLLKIFFLLLLIIHLLIAVDQNCFFFGHGPKCL